MGNDPEPRSERVLQMFIRVPGERRAWLALWCIGRLARLLGGESDGLVQTATVFDAAEGSALDAPQPA